jgi:hypothetical protein
VTRHPVPVVVVDRSAAAAVEEMGRDGQVPGASDAPRHIFDVSIDPEGLLDDDHCPRRVRRRWRPGDEDVHRAI